MTTSRNRSQNRSTPAARRKAETSPQNVRCAPTLWDGLESRVPQRRGGVSAGPRTISRAAPPRTCLPCLPDVCRVRANYQNRSSARVVRRRDLQPGHGVPRQAEQRGAGSARNRRFRHAAGNAAACDESPATPADQNGRRPHKGRRAQRTAGNPAVRFDPQQPRLTKTGGAHKALQTFHWPMGTAVRDKGKREISAGAVREDETGCEQDDRNISTAIPLSTDRSQASVECEVFLTTTAEACPATAALWSPDTAPGDPRRWSRSSEPDIQTVTAVQDCILIQQRGTVRTANSVTPQPFGTSCAQGKPPPYGPPTSTSRPARTASPLATTPPVVPRPRL